MKRVRRVIALIDALGREAYENERAVGAAMSLDEAIGRARLLAERWPVEQAPPH